MCGRKAGQIKHQMGGCRKAFLPTQKSELLSANGVFECNFRRQISHCNAHASVIETFDSAVPGDTEKVLTTGIPARIMTQRRTKNQKSECPTKSGMDANPSV